MAETLSPNPTTVQKQRPPMLSPASPFFLGSNDDKLERARARAERAAAIRRKPAAAPAAALPPTDPCLDKNQILELFQNLQASCTLEAGVKIYSMRVDSVHSEAYKVLGGINRVGQENEQGEYYIDCTLEDANISSGQEEGNSKKEHDKKLSPLSTLESSFEALNVKKFDAAFAVDPLYHQTSAQFDEGGAKGLLLNNLGLYGGCRVLFDSLEVPGKSMSSTSQHDNAEAIDISYARDCIEQMLLNMPQKDEISPSLREIVNRFAEDNGRASDAFSSDQTSAEHVFETYNNYDAELDGDAYDNCGTWDYDNGEQTSVVDEGAYGGDLPSHHEETETNIFHGPDVDDRFAKVDGYLFLSLGFASKQNAWAGPDHWKYRKAKGLEEPTKENGSPLTTKKPRSKKQAEIDIDFTKALENDDLSDVFAPPKNPKTLLLPANRVPCNTLLPEDCHYQPEELVKLFILPNVMCLGRRGRKPSDESSQQRDEYGPMPTWDDEGGFGGEYDDGNAYSDVEDSSTLVSQPRQVNKIEVQYDKTSKQVDVQALKVTLWDCMQESQAKSVQAQEETLSFRQILATFPNKCRAAASLDEISPHLCFICLLHLANEHGLSIHGCSNLDDLSILLPTSNDKQQGMAFMNVG
ncbi:hypothetical protein LguiA_035282 [Lonicera macranthoides]